MTKRFELKLGQEWAMTRPMSLGHKDRMKPQQVQSKVDMLQTASSKILVHAYLCILEYKAIYKEQRAFFKTFISQMNRRQLYNRDWKKKISACCFNCKASFTSGSDT